MLEGFCPAGPDSRIILLNSVLGNRSSKLDLHSGCLNHDKTKCGGSYLLNFILQFLANDDLALQLLFLYDKKLGFMKTVADFTDSLAENSLSKYPLFLAASLQYTT
jgi:hypothetical protein